MLHNMLDLKKTLHKTFFSLVCVNLLARINE